VRRSANFTLVRGCQLRETRSQSKFLGVAAGFSPRGPGMRIAHLIYEFGVPVHGNAEAHSLRARAEHGQVDP